MTRYRQKSSRARIDRFAGRMGAAVTADLKDRIARMWTSERLT